MMAWTSTAMRASTRKGAIAFGCASEMSPLAASSEPSAAKSPPGGNRLEATPIEA